MLQPHLYLPENKEYLGSVLNWGVGLCGRAPVRLADKSRFRPTEHRTRLWIDGTGDAVMIYSLITLWRYSGLQSHTHTQTVSQIQGLSHIMSLCFTHTHSITQSCQTRQWYLLPVCSNPPLCFHLSSCILGKMRKNCGI